MQTSAAFVPPGGLALCILMSPRLLSKLQELRGASELLSSRHLADRLVPRPPFVQTTDKALSRPGAFQRGCFDGTPTDGGPVNDPEQVYTGLSSCCAPAITTTDLGPSAYSNTHVFGW